MPLTLSALNVYPVKGLKGIALTQARCTERGLEHDRRWMVVDPEDNFLSQRELPKMATIWTEIGKGISPCRRPTWTRWTYPSRRRIRLASCWSPSGTPNARRSRFGRSRRVALGLPVDGVPLRLHARQVRRLSNPKYAGEGKLVGFADGYAYLLTADESLADLNARLAARKQGEVPMNRFRPNLVISGAEPYAEDGWKRIHIGQATFAAAKPCGRCQVPTTDQATGEVTGPEPLATLATYRDSKEFGTMFGMNLVMEKVGVVRVGDEVRVE
jgi:uncharacterized protein YcbX